MAYLRHPSQRNTLCINCFGHWLHALAKLNRVFRLSATADLTLAMLVTKANMEFLEGYEFSNAISQCDKHISSWRENDFCVESDSQNVVAEWNSVMKIKFRTWKLVSMTMQSPFWLFTRYPARARTVTYSINNLRNARFLHLVCNSASLLQICLTQPNCS